jgi:hypothetical protein
MLEMSVQDPPTWLVVAGHYPVYSNGNNGDTLELQAYLQPLLEKYNVHAYICGHDHISEHLRHKGIEYFVVGSGSMIDYLGSASTEAEEFIWYGVGYNAFAVMDATSDTLKISYIDPTNTERYSYTLTNPNPLAPRIGDADRSGNSGRNKRSIFQFFSSLSSSDSGPVVVSAFGLVALVGLSVIGLFAYKKAGVSSKASLKDKKYGTSGRDLAEYDQDPHGDCDEDDLMVTKPTATTMWTSHSDDVSATTPLPSRTPGSAADIEEGPSNPTHSSNLRKSSMSLHRASSSTTKFHETTAARYTVADDGDDDENNDTPRATATRKFVPVRSSSSAGAEDGVTSRGYAVEQPWLFHIFSYGTASTGNSGGEYREGAGVDSAPVEESEAKGEFSKAKANSYHKRNKTTLF